LPNNVRIQEFYDGLYLVFNKGKDAQRLSMTKKLPANYNINKELHSLNMKTIEKYGNDHAIPLERFPYDPSSDNIEIPENV
jgi:hypothetical protein